MIRHFCDECGEELSIVEIAYCNEMIGHDLCHKHISEYEEFLKNHFPKVYKKTSDWIKKYL